MNEVAATTSEVEEMSPTPGLRTAREWAVTGYTLVTSAVIAFLGGPHALLPVLGWLVVLDCLANWMARVYRSEPFSRDRVMKGIAQKASYFIVIAAMDRIGPAIGFRELDVLFILYFCIQEAQSVLRHAGLCGITLPNWVGAVLDKAASQIKRKG